MSVQLDELMETSKYLLPWSTFLIGLVGSTHCAGMCGGLVMSCTPKAINNSFYQIGRLVSYCAVAVALGLIGQSIGLKDNQSTLALISGVSIGLIFIYMGFSQFRNKSPKKIVPGKLQHLLYKIWGKILPSNPKNVSLGASFLVGSFSILLPCGLFYSVALTLGAFESPFISLICIFTFWLGTIPVMALAPTLIKRFLRPLSLKLPLMTSMLLIMIGLFTVYSRVYTAMNPVIHSCH